MEISTKKDGCQLCIAVEGNIDTITAPHLSREISDQCDAGITTLILDLTGVKYMSSMGLRTVMAADRLMTQHQGKFMIKNPNQEVRELFEMTGLDSLLDIE